VGMLYVDSFGSIIPGWDLTNAFRATASYELKPAEILPRWGRFLGRHRLAAFYEDRSSDSRTGVNLRTSNVTPLPGFNNDIRHAQNRVLFRYYLDPSQGIVTAGRDLTKLIPYVVYANDPMPERDPSGITTAFIAHQPGWVSYRGVSSRMFAMQNFFWRDRIVTSFGWRTDDVTDYSASGANFFTPFLDSRGLAPDTRLFSARHDFPGTRSSRSSNNSTQGVVFHALPWLSLSYNQSTNFAVGSGWRNVYGRTLPNPKGRGRDYGLKFALLRDRLIGSVTYYTERRTDRSDTTVSQGLHGNFQNVINSIWGAIAREENKPEYNNFPYASGFNTWQDTSTGASSGYELGLTFNATPNWRMTFNAAKRGEDTTRERGTHIQAYLAEFLPAWKGNAQWMGYLIDDSSSSTNARTVGGAVANLENILANFNALNGVTANTLHAPAWSFNYVTNYRFRNDSVLRGVGIGGSAQFRGKAILGFAEGPNQVFDIDRPYHGKQTDTYGAWISYTRRIFNDKVRWRIQLNVRNVFDQNMLLPLRIVDSRDGQATPSVIKYRLAEGRGFVTTSSFEF
jgi:iron complex outermembrane recepter protein